MPTEIGQLLGDVLLGDVRAGDEILLPGADTWRVVQTIAAPEADGIEWVAFTDGTRHGFDEGALVTVRRGSPGTGTERAMEQPQPPPDPPPASVPLLVEQDVQRRP